MDTRVDFEKLLGEEIANQEQITGRKLDAKAASEIKSYLMDHKQSVLDCDGKNCVFIMGMTGAGISTLTNYLAGVPLKKIPARFEKEKFEIDAKNYDGSVTTIGHSCNSQTMLTVLMTDKDGEHYVDCAGFFDNRSELAADINAIAIRIALRLASERKIVYVINSHNITAGEFYKDIDYPHQLDSILINSEKLAASTVVVVTNADKNIELVGANKHHVKSILDEEHFKREYKKYRGAITRSATNEEGVVRLLHNARRFLVAGNYLDSDTRLEIRAALDVVEPLDASCLQQGLNRKEEGKSLQISDAPKLSTYINDKFKLKAPIQKNNLDEVVSLLANGAKFKKIKAGLIENPQIQGLIMLLQYIAKKEKIISYLQKINRSALALHNLHAHRSLKQLQPRLAAALALKKAVFDTENSATVFANYEDEFYHGNLKRISIRIMPMISDLRARHQQCKNSK